MQKLESKEWGRPLALNAVFVGIYPDGLSGLSMETKSSIRMKQYLKAR